MNLWRDKTVILAVTGSIAAYKAAALASQLYQAGALVYVAMTGAAAHFVSPLTFEALTHRPVARDVLALGADSEIEHVALARAADLVLIAPATANTLAKLAHGLADDIVSAIALDTRAPIVVAPAMETGMWENTATQTNLAQLKARGVVVVEPQAGHLASGASGVGRMAEPATILGWARQVLARRGALAGRQVVITSGGTREPIDPVRFISNHSSGKMGIALADEALARGAQVHLITTVDDPPPAAGADVTRVMTTDELRAAVLSALPAADILVMAAAPADYRVRNYRESKIKKEASDSLTLELARNPDILGAVASARGENPSAGPRVVVGFAAETDDLIDNARAKLQHKRLDMIVANPVPQTFGSEYVKATILTTTGIEIDVEPMPKEQLAGIVFDQIEQLLRE